MPKRTARHLQDMVYEAGLQEGPLDRSQFRPSNPNEIEKMMADLEDARDLYAKAAAKTYEAAQKGFVLAKKTGDQDYTQFANTLMGVKARTSLIRIGNQLRQKSRDARKFRR